MKNNEFTQKVENFINLLKTTEIKDYFNSWIEVNKNDKEENAFEIRCENLKQFLTERENAKYILIGEAPSYGARYTGIPMTSDQIIYEKPEIFSKNEYKLTSLTIHTEKTASIIWDEILKLDKTGKNFVMWNAFAFHDIDQKYVKIPTEKQISIDENIKILKTFLSLFPDSKIIALGRKAQFAVSQALTEYVRHPSHGGEKTFRENFKLLIEK